MSIGMAAGLSPSILAQAGVIGAGDGLNGALRVSCEAQRALMVKEIHEKIKPLETTLLEPIDFLQAQMTQEQIDEFKSVKPTGILSTEDYNSLLKTSDKAHRHIDSELGLPYEVREESEYHHKGRSIIPMTKALAKMMGRAPFNIVLHYGGWYLIDLIPAGLEIMSGFKGTYIYSSTWGSSSLRVIKELEEFEKWFKTHSDSNKILLGRNDIDIDTLNQSCRGGGADFSVLSKANFLPVNVIRPIITDSPITYIILAHTNGNNTPGGCAQDILTPEQLVDMVLLPEECRKNTVGEYDKAKVSEETKRNREQKLDGRSNTPVRNKSKLGR